MEKTFYAELRDLDDHYPLPGTHSYATAEAAIAGWLTTDTTL